MHNTNTNHHTLHTALRRAVMMGVCALATLFTVPTIAQTIGGNVYGGGNQGDLEGNANVELKGGTVKGNVYGGARMADITGRTYVHINGEEATSALIVKGVYGGNDIAGQILKNVGVVTKPYETIANSIVNARWEEWNAFVRTTASNTYPIIIGSLYGGGNGDYNYIKNTDDNTKFDVTLAEGTYTVDYKPELAKTYLEVNGGIYGNIYGGGNNVTVTEETVIYTNNTTEINGTLNSIPLADNEEFLGLLEEDDYRIEGEDENEKMVFDYHASRVFGGNNKVDMDIRPTWHLEKADINNLYSGGNRGAMTYDNGIIIPIQSPSMRINSLYGGCRIANVNPGGLNGTATLTDETLYGHDFHAGYATRVYITDGRINNVYGGNDISGKVFHGSNVDIHGGLIGNVYGGGNGSYAYTDNLDWKANNPKDADYYYIPGDNSIEALYNFRPHVESTLIHLSGKDEDNKLVIAGNVFCGGNSATLAKDGDPAGARATIKIGKHTIINGVFFGSNGIHMVDSKVLAKYADNNFSSIDLTNANQMKRYMDGVAVNILPELIWEDDIDQDNMPYIGSLYFGGNKGSMTYEGMGDFTIPRNLVIYEKVVGGCNDACVVESSYNAALHGGVTGAGVGDNGVKVKLTMNAYLKPMTLEPIYDGQFVDSYKFGWDVTEEVWYETFDNDKLQSKTFVDANVYGGCFNSGHIEGGTMVNISMPLIHRDVFSTTEINGIIPKNVLHATGEDVYGSAMAIYGAGYGELSEVHGNTYVNLTDKASALLVFGGGEKGVVNGNTEVNFNQNMYKDQQLPHGDYCIQDSINVYKAYGAGYAGTVTGNSTLNLYSGGVMRAFGGACNAHVKGVTTAIVGWRDEEHDEYNYGRPFVANAVFGGNDFGGKVIGDALRTIEVKDYNGNVIETKKVRSQTYLQYISGNIGKALYGGSYGSYNYVKSDIYNAERGEPLGGGPDFTSVITDDDAEVITANTFVDIPSQSRNVRDIIGAGTLKDKSMVTGIVGGGRGYRNLPGYVRVNQTYVLLHGADYTYRHDPLAYRVYGGGNLSTVNNTRIDYLAGNFERIFGGTHGVKTFSTEDNVAYNVNNTLINVYDGVHYPVADIYGAGANSGTDKATINLYGGEVHDVHGGAFTEGYTLETHIKVPGGSTAKVNAIYGGGWGEEEGCPCDVGQSNIHFASHDANVKLGIFGGNNSARVTTQTHITIEGTVKDGETLKPVYGAGNGENTVSGFTVIELRENAQVGNVYGGGLAGKVYNHYKYYGNTGDNDIDYAINDYYDNAPHRHGNWVNDAIQPEAGENVRIPLNASQTNTLVRIQPGATVNGHVYGGGQGDKAYVSGETKVELLGGTVNGNIYGGGEEGPMPRMTDEFNGYIAAEESKQDISTWCAIDGGEVYNVYGGGYVGDIDGNARVEIGKNLTSDNGLPTVQRSVYGGGEEAKVTETTVNMYNGYVGYKHQGNNTYIALLDFRKENDGVLKENGNLFGGGYGDNAKVVNSHVNLYGGTIRNGLYGGGEISAIGYGTMKRVNDMYELDHISIPGTTQVRMYGGKVEGDVFGGGRGYSYDLTGNQIIGKIYSDGYVFGSTDVEIYRGVIGTVESVKEGHGNVFGGGNIGNVYSVGTKYQPEKKETNIYTDEEEEANSSLANKLRTSATDDKLIEGHYYYTVDDPTTAVDETTLRTEDCRVHITARCMALEDVTIGDTDYKAGEYVLTEHLDMLAFDAPEWEMLDDMGITIRNAVFAGGNVSSGSDKIYANAVTVFGNATAAVVDVYAKDLISLGGEHVGGLYGDGNLTFVDGYRELNITNYGTDYYNMSSELSYEDYLKLSDREKDYYTLMHELKSGQKINFTYKGVTYRYEYIEDYTTEIPDNIYRNMLGAWIAWNREEMEKRWTVNDTEYKVKTENIYFTHNGKNYSYTVSETYNQTQYKEMLEAYAAYQQAEMEKRWDVMGVCTVTAGRMMNTIQRADFCGVFGSRIILHGAQDRVPDVVDYTNYTINRVGEVSLNRVSHTFLGDDEPTEHGNYFGIYNVVNFLGAMTSDVEFQSPREVEGVVPDGEQSYYDYKLHHQNSRDRNNASSDNMVALASGAFLELVKELDENGNKVYGPVTGVIQLDMINVQPGEGGGYVYAKNEHGEPHEVDEEEKAHLTLSDANKGAITHSAFTYDENVDNLRMIQTSGNFVHATKRIVDDCFPRGGYYNPEEEGYSPAHYWFVRGDFYVYDQYLSAYTGASQAYSQEINIPLTITAGSDGKMQLVSVNPNKYAYFVGKHYRDKVLEAGDSVLAGTTTYHMNDPISYWDWSQLTETEKSYFVDSTYVAICDATIDGNDYVKGDVLLPTDYRTLLEKAPKGVIDEKDHKGDPIEVLTDSVFRISNELSHKAGYLLTFDLTNPLKWDDYYTTIDGTAPQTKLGSEYDNLTAAEQDKYIEAPTLLCNESGIYGQRSYEVNDLVNESVIESHKKLSESTVSAILNAYNAIKDSQAAFEPAYVVTAQEISFKHDGKDYHMYKGSYMSKTMYDSDALQTLRDNVEEAYICVSTIEIADKEYVLQGDLIPASQYQTLCGNAGNVAHPFLGGKNMADYFTTAHVCTTEGKYGGSYFEIKNNYHALQFCGLSYDERNKLRSDKSPVFTYNFDALDLLATDFDPNIELYREPYSITQPVDYKAKYIGEKAEDNNETYTYAVRVLEDEEYKGNIQHGKTINEGENLTREQYEMILNEKSHFMPIHVTSIKKTQEGHEDEDSIYYVVKEMFEKANIYYPEGRVISETDYNLMTDDQKTKIDPKTFDVEGTYFYCVEDFVLSTETKGKSLAELDGKAEMETGEIIKAETFDSLPNYQLNFAISGHSPIETSTLYVAQESDILNLSKDRVITVEYKYTYKEPNADDGGYEIFVEKHVVNIHVQFKSGLPTIGNVNAPATVLPNSVVGLSAPSVTKGAYEILGGGWEMFETLEDAYEHKNGIAYKNNATPMYWYQNNYYVAYYAKTYLGKAYSDPVPFSIANYHRLGEVMNHPEYMHIDHKDVDRASKIYLDAAEYETTSIAASETQKNDLDYMIELYEKSLDADILDERVKGGNNLVFILRSDIAPKFYATWESIGTNENCFAGTLHGNGYTISKLDNSLFGKLCGSVYNLGVTGTFTSGGIANDAGDASDGYAENCWVYTTATPSENINAVFSTGGTIVNSYYREDNAFAEGQAIKETKTDFEQGEVAYQLNRFYLHKRYSDNPDVEIPEKEKYKYNYYKLDVENNTLALESSYYADDYAIYSYGKLNKGYVEKFYADGDFVYANGTVPLEDDERFDLEKSEYYPIYPDDYIFFGQALTYGIRDHASHGSLPAYVKKEVINNKTRIVRSDEGNRVYRAPAYYMSNEKKEAYFNKKAVFVDSYDDTPVDHDMTAIDLTGYNDEVCTNNAYMESFYLPYLDYEGLTSITINGLTQNLLVYADPVNDDASYNVLDRYLYEPILDYGEYNTIQPQANLASMHGHLVDLVGAGKYSATRDHYLVDKQNFNAPIPYKYAKNCYMWYQRTPDRFANRDNKGWDIVCLPFTAGMVTTHQKGEITHFYEGSTKMHEYWLRQSTDITTEGDVVKITFERPEAGNNSYAVDNDFLYQYYYSVNEQKDANTDLYQDYYSKEREYYDYPYLTAQIPYIIAFPGSEYYEFDMSGNFVPEHTASDGAFKKLERQLVTMVSINEAEIAVTDAENRTTTLDGYQFVGTYQKDKLPVGYYTIDGTGGSFAAIDNATVAVPFRGYLMKTSETPAPPRHIFISHAIEEEEPIEEVTDRGLTIYGNKGTIYIESTLEHEATVTIHSLSGKIIRRIVVQPMTKEIVPMSSRGVYIVNNRKITVL